MKVEIAEQWVQALLSGEYKQGRGKLRRSNRQFCCLGVLTDLAVKAGVCEWVKDGTGYGIMDPEDDYLSVTSLSTSVKRWAGLEDVDTAPSVFIEGAQENLINLNDGIGEEYRSYSFKEIAGFIKDQLCEES